MCPVPHVTSHSPAKRLADPPSPQPSWPAQIPPAPASSHGRSLMLLSRPCWRRRSIFRSLSPRSTRSCATSGGPAALTSPGASCMPPPAAPAVHEHIAHGIVHTYPISLYKRSVLQVLRCSAVASLSAPLVLMRRRGSFIHVMYELCALGAVAGSPVWRVQRSDACSSAMLCCAEVLIKRCLYFMYYACVGAALSAPAVRNLRCTHSAFFRASKRRL